MNIIRDPLFYLAFVIACGLWLWSETATADHHPLEMCQPQVGALPDPNAVNCSRGGPYQEPTNHTFSIGRLQVGDIVWVPVRFNNTASDLCEAGIQIAYPWNLQFRNYYGNMDVYTQAELDSVSDNGCSPSGNTCGGLTGSTIPITGFVSFEGGHGGAPANTTECPECVNAAHFRLWSYTGPGRAPMDLLGDPTRIWMWFKFEVGSLFGAPGAHRIAVQDGWVVEPLPGGLCDCGNQTDANGRGCDPLTTMETWTDLPNGVETNQAYYTVDCWTADFDRDGFVGISDYGIFSQAFNNNTGGYYDELRPDSDDDGDVDITDFGAFKQRYQAQDASCF